MFCVGRARRRVERSGTAGTAVPAISATITLYRVQPLSRADGDTLYAACGCAHTHTRRQNADCGTQENDMHEFCLEVWPFHAYLEGVWLFLHQ